jgi:ribosomal protein S18 acetylase RimI-like enzyme
MQKEISTGSSIITLRPVLPEDAALLLEVYASTRADEMALVPWTDEQKAAFLKMQFLAQQQDYESSYPQAQHFIILSNEAPMGRLYLSREDDAVKVLDLAILPQHRRHGIGTSLIKDLCAEANATGKPLRIYVESYNHSLSFFERLGFYKIEEVGFYFHLEWRRTS